jgi:hypothetical protein
VNRHSHDCQDAVYQVPNDLALRYLPDGSFPVPHPGRGMTCLPRFLFYSAAGVQLSSDGRLPNPNESSLDERLTVALNVTCVPLSTRISSFWM